MTKPKLILTTVGISCLLNALQPEERQEWREKINRHANLYDLNIDPGLKQKTEEIALRVISLLEQGSPQSNRRLSAELNGIYGIYNDQLSQGQNDLHFLVATDTAFGKLAAELIEGFLNEKGFAVQTYCPEQLTSAEPDRFSQGIKNLIGWCEENLQHFRDQYYIIFNLTGAFKSLQGYMNIAGMFYADEIVYIFETGSSLLRIPRLPIRVDDKELRIWRTELALLSQGHVYEADQVEGLPDALLDKDKSSHVSLSDWGIVIWNRIREGLLSEELLPFPRLQYEGKFSRDFRQISNKEKFALQEVLAKVSSLLESHNGDTSALKSDGGLQYDNYTNQRTPDGSPIGHFRVSQGLRVSCVMNGGILTLRRYGREPDVNGNP